MKDGKHPVSGYMLVLNEINSVHCAVSSLLKQVDELIVSDSGSTDGTLDVLSDFARSNSKVKLFIRPQNSDRYSTEWNEPARRNWCISECAHDWVLTLDGDETFDDIPADYFKSVNTPLNFNRFIMGSRTHYVTAHHENGDWNRHFYPDVQTRYYPKTCRHENKPLHCHIMLPDGSRAGAIAVQSDVHIWHWRMLVKTGWSERLLGVPETFELKPVNRPIPVLLPAKFIV